MTSGSNVQGGRQKRRRGSLLPLSHSIYDLTMLFLLGAVSIVGIWLFGGVHLWSIGPMKMATGIVGILFALRFFISPYRKDIVIPPGGFVFLALLLYLGIVFPFADIPYEARVESWGVMSYGVACLGGGQS